MHTAMRQLVFLGACLTLGIGAGACGGGGEAESQPETSSAESSTQESSTLATDEPVVDVIEIDGSPVSVALGEEAAWVVLNQQNAVARIDPVSAQIDGEPIPVGEAPAGAAEEAGDVWVANTFGDTVTRIDSKTGEVVGKPIALVTTRWPSQRARTGPGSSTRSTAPSLASTPRRGRCSPRPHV